MNNNIKKKVVTKLLIFLLTIGKKCVRSCINDATYRESQ